jgi:hypothetical protein
MSKEKRRTRRQPMRHTAWVAPTPQQRFECVVSDVSETGARIEVNDGTSVPDCFVLLLSSNGAARRFCRVVWRRPRQIGVKFEASFAAAANPAHPSSADESAAPPPLEMDEPAAIA